MLCYTNLAVFSVIIVICQSTIQNSSVPNEVSLELDEPKLDTVSEDAVSIREGRILPFNGFQTFRGFIIGGNTKCIHASGNSKDERHGFCYPRNKCTQMGGDVKDSCDKLGMSCCIINASCGRNKESITIRRDTVYIRHKKDDDACSTDYKFPKQSNVCQLRLEFKIFNTAQPSAFADCEKDILTIKKAANFRNNFILCGKTNETDHLYLHYGESNEIVVNLDVSKEADVDILVQQIKCNSPNAAPYGCSQYFTPQKGEVRSFNFDRTTGQQLNSQVYTVCIKGTEGTEKVTWSTCTGTKEDFDISSYDDAGCVVGEDLRDSVTIPGTANTLYCNHTGFPTSLETRAKPFAMYVNFNEVELIRAPPTCPALCWIVDPSNPTQCIPTEASGCPKSDLHNRGFCLRYQRG